MNDELIRSVLEHYAATGLIIGAIVMVLDMAIQKIFGDKPISPVALALVMVGWPVALGIFLAVAVKKYQDRR